jgi:hypothetical protein
MRAVRPAAVAFLALVILLILVAPRPALATAPQLPSATSAPPRATSLPGADEATQNEVDDILTSAAIVLVSGAVGIAGLMWGRL